MPSTARMTVVGLAGLAAALALLSASAQAAPPRQEPYPPPCECVVIVSAGETAPSTGECIPITCEVKDAEGAPAAQVECTMSILSQPATDATLTPASAMTDEQGKATAELCVGSTPGPIAVLAEAQCCQAQVQVTAQAPTPAPPESVPPAVLPVTGAGTSSGDFWSASVIAICSAIALAAGAVLVWRIGSRPHRSS